MPNRVQRKRSAGWRKPEGAIYVGRGSKWGNPTRVVYRKDTGGWHAEHDNGGSVGVWPDAAGARDFARAAYHAYLLGHPDLVSAARTELAGRDLLCWCPTDEPCHAEFLLHVAAGGDLR